MTVGVFKALLDVANAKFKVVGDVRRWRVVVFTHVAASAQGRVGNRRELVVQQRRAVLHGLKGVGHIGQDVVFDFDEFQGLLRNVGVRRRHPQRWRGPCRAPCRRP